MTRDELQALIDRVIGKKGILRAPSWWVRRLFNGVIAYSEESANTAIRIADKKAEVYVLPEAGVYALNSATGKKLLDIMNNPDKYMIQRLVDYSGGEILVPYHIYRIDNVTDSIRIGSPAWHTSTGTLSPGREVSFQLTSYRGVISKGTDGDYIEINYEDNDIRVLSTQLDTEMSDISIWPVQNKVVKKYVDGKVGDINTILDTINGEEV